MRRAALAAGLLLAGCADRVADAEQEYALVEKTHAEPDAERCAAARKVRDAALAARDQAKYRLWDLVAVADCGGRP